MADMHSVAEKMRLSEPTAKTGMNIELYYLQQKYRSVSLVSGGIRFVLIFVEVLLERGRQTTVGLSRTAIFSVLTGYFSETLEMRPALL